MHQGISSLLTDDAARAADTSLVRLVAVYGVHNRVRATLPQYADQGGSIFADFVIAGENVNQHVFILVAGASKGRILAA